MSSKCPCRSRTQQLTDIPEVKRNKEHNSLERKKGEFASQGTVNNLHLQLILRGHEQVYHLSWQSAMWFITWELQTAPTLQQLQRYFSLDRSRSSGEWMQIGDTSPQLRLLLWFLMSGGRGDGGGCGMVTHWVLGAMVTPLAASHSEEAEAGFCPPGTWARWSFCAEKLHNHSDTHCFSPHCLYVCPQIPADTDI